MDTIYSLLFIGIACCQLTCPQTLCASSNSKTNFTCYKKWGNNETYFFSPYDFYYTDPNDKGRYCPIYDPLFANFTVNYRDRIPNGASCNYSMQCSTFYCNSLNICSNKGGRNSPCSNDADCTLSFLCNGQKCVGGRPVGIHCYNHSDCDIMTSLCYNQFCTAYYSLPEGTNVASDQEFLCEEAIAIGHKCVARSNLPQLIYSKGNKYKECKQDSDCTYNKGSVTDIFPLCQCAEGSADSTGYCVYGGGETEMIDAYKYGKSNYYKKSAQIIAALKDYTRRDTHILFVNPAKCSLNEFYRKSEGILFKSTAMLLLFAILI